MQHTMHYYRVAIIDSASPLLVYHSTKYLKPGSIVMVPLRNTIKRAVVVQSVSKPDFSSKPIETVLHQHYESWQLDVAHFIASYYFATLGEAIGLFHPFSAPHPPFKTLKLQQPKLTPKQAACLKQLDAHERALLFGVTGSGKTEVLICAISEVLKEGKTALFLMPEIALTPQIGKRLQAYFGDAVAIWHSQITKKKKEHILSQIEAGVVRVIAGARSALFVPLSHLGLIIVDEEHDDSYKSQTRPRYHARDLALYLAKKRHAKVILSSATPTVSSFHKYPVVRLSTPYIKTQKQFRFIKGEGITPPVVYAIRECVDEGHQALVFIPTRANFKYLYCSKCGKCHTCPYCSVGMALHKKNRYLKCHYCNFTEAIRESCAFCSHTPLQSERIGTQEAEEILSEAIAHLRIERLDRDRITTATKLEKALRRFERHEADVLIGTQMLSKGHDYPNLTVSIILGLDHIAGIGDYRARERAMSLFFQIAGRSGRAQNAEVIIQSANPSFFEPYIGNYEIFLQEELIFRELGEYPPFVSLARILIAHSNDTKANRITQQTLARLRPFSQIQIVGHGRAPIEKIANKYRYTILLRSKSRTPLLQALHAINSHEIEIDMDPVDFS